VDAGGPAESAGAAGARRRLRRVTGDADVKMTTSSLRTRRVCRRTPRGAGARGPHGRPRPGNVAKNADPGRPDERRPPSDVPAARRGRESPSRGWRRRTVRQLMPGTMHGTLCTLPRVRSCELAPRAVCACGKNASTARGHGPSAPEAAASQPPLPARGPAAVERRNAFLPGAVGAGGERLAGGARWGARAPAGRPKMGAHAGIRGGWRVRGRLRREAGACAPRRSRCLRRVTGGRDSPRNRALSVPTSADANLAGRRQG
jgi:hypothetical protein